MILNIMQESDPFSVVFDLSQAQWRIRSALNSVMFAAKLSCL